MDPMAFQTRTLWMVALGLEGDAARNGGPLGRSSPPGGRPGVTPPIAPRITRLSAGDRQITLEWASNREPDLAEYRVYRTADANRAHDVRLMDLVHTVPVVAGDPAARPARLSWTDSPVPGQRDLWYRVVAVDGIDANPRHRGGHVSAQSPAMRARAFDLAPPAAPAFTSVAWVRVDSLGTVHPWSEPVPAGDDWLPAVQLAWATAPGDVRLIVQVRSESDTGFNPVSDWLPPGTTAYLHRNTRTFEAHTYRLKVDSGAGNASEVVQPAILAVP